MEALLKVLEHFIRITLYFYLSFYFLAFTRNRKKCNRFSISGLDSTLDTQNDIQQKNIYAHASNV